jgi:hypothetical protein
MTTNIQYNTSNNNNNNKMTTQSTTATKQNDHWITDP